MMQGCLDYGREKEGGFVLVARRGGLQINSLLHPMRREKYHW
jgi:hypothetical protein